MDYCRPPMQEVLEKISRHCPAALSAYLQCLNRADDKGEIFFDRQMVEVLMSEEWEKFRRHIKMLAKENLLMWTPINRGIHVTLAEI